MPEDEVKQNLYGMDKEIAAKMQAKLDPEQIQKAIAWIEELTGETVGEFHAGLKNGWILCKLINVIKPGMIAKPVQTPKNILVEQANIQYYTEACMKLGVPSQELFTVADLHSGKCLSAVLLNIFALGRQVQVIPGYNGPRLGVKYSVTLEETQRRKEKKKEEAQKLYDMAMKEERRKKHRSEILEREKKEEVLKEKRKSQEKLLERRLSKGRTSTLEYDAMLKDLWAKYDNDLANIDELELDVGPILYGMDLEHQKKMKAKLDDDGADQQLQEIMDWLEEVTGNPIDDLHEALKSGTMLCNIVNKIRPGTIPKFEKRADTATKISFKAGFSRDNIKLYLGACEAIGIARAELFNVSDLYDQKDFSTVLKNLAALKRKAQPLLKSEEANAAAAKAKEEERKKAEAATKAKEEEERKKKSALAAAAKAKEEDERQKAEVAAKEAAAAKAREEEEKRKVAAAKAREEEEKRKAAAAKAKEEEERRKAAAAKAREEEERRKAATAKAKEDEERRKAATAAAKAKEEEEKRKAAKAKEEQHKIAAKKARKEAEKKQAELAGQPPLPPVTPPPPPTEVVEIRPMGFLERLMQLKDLALSSKYRWWMFGLGAITVGMVVAYYARRGFSKPNK